MIITPRVILLIVAFVVFLAAAGGVKHTRIELLPVGLALWVLALLL